MPDWQELVRRRLPELALDLSEKEEVHAELAAHLEESYEAVCKQGLGESEAARRTFEQVPDWQELQHKISAAKRREHPMKKRVQQLWIPGFLTFLLFTLFLAIVQKAGFRPRIVGSGPNAILFYVPWLAGLPFFGALGAYLSSRAGGSRRTMVLSSVFPVLAFGGTFVFLFPIDVVVKWIIGRKVYSFAIVATTILRDGTSWLLLPGAALFLGGLVANLLIGRPSSSHGAAIGGETSHA